jgi:putative DNA primase/helicase
MEDASTLAAAAAWYADHKIPVFPCKPRDKAPLTRHGFKEATIDQARINSWWRKFPNANIGVPTGAPSGLMAVDIDPRNGGEDSLDDLILKYGRFPETAEQLTGGGGRHFIFLHPGIRLLQTLSRGIDLKGDGGYIIVAPSVHPSGRVYQWDGLEGSKALLKPAEVPRWLLECAVKATVRKLRTPGVRAQLPNAERWRPGERNNRLTSHAGLLRSRGMARAAIEAELLKENERRCEPPLELNEVLRIAASVARYPAGVRASDGVLKAFTPPGYASAYDALMDVLRFAADLPEFLVLLFHIERSLAYGKASDCSSLSQMVDGVASRELNAWIRKGCGLGKAAVTRANKALARSDRQLLFIRRRSSPALGNEPTEYEVNWPAVSRYIAERKQQPIPPLVSLRYKPLYRYETHIITIRGHEGSGRRASSVCLARSRCRDGTPNMVIALTACLEPPLSIVAKFDRLALPGKPEGVPFHCCYCVWHVFGVALLGFNPREGFFDLSLLNQSVELFQRRSHRQDGNPERRCVGNPNRGYAN